MSESANSLPATEALRTLLHDAFDRIREHVREVTAHLSRDQLLWRPTPDANSVGWLVWHSARVQDAQIAPIADVEQAWTADGWYERFKLPYPPVAHGYGQTSAEVGQFRATPELLTGYYEDVHRLTSEYLDRITDEELSRVVDRGFVPEVTVSARLVSILDDCAQHLGQAKYLLGIYPALHGTPAHR